MWLKTVAGQSTQSSPGGGSSPSRSFSPLPRRPTQQGPPSNGPLRPGLTPRTSSLGALVSASTESLPPAARFHNGSSLLRTELTQSVNSTSEAGNPTDVLFRILGTATKPPSATPTLTEDVDFEGLSLQAFAEHIAVPPYEPNIIDDFEKEKDSFETLHSSITQCDGILGEVEKYLASFRADLAAVSTEIEALQHRSSSLNSKLQNRRVVEKVLGPQVESFTIPPKLVEKLISGPLDEAWLKALDDLERRAKVIKLKLNEEKVARAAADLRPILDDISDKVVERVRDHVVAQIKGLRSPNINAQIIQQTALVKYRNAFAFLAQRQPELAQEIEQAYVNTMRWYFQSNFGRYRAAIARLAIHIVDVGETIAADPAKRSTKAVPHDAFSIGRRLDILRLPNSSALSSYVAEESKDTHYMEVAFRTFNLALIDNASAEYAFLAAFFHKQPVASINRKFNDIWHPTFDLGHAFTKQLVEQNQDAIGVLLCVRLNQKFAFELQRRKVAAVEGYIFGTNMILWPRFQMILDSHCDSIRKLTQSLSGRPTGSALTLTASTAAAPTTAPHPLTQRFANFVEAILTLSSEAGDDEPVANSLGRLRSEYEAFLTKASKGIADARKRDRFLHNNYSLVCTIIAEVEGKLADEVRDRFLELRDDLKLDA